MLSRAPLLFDVRGCTLGIRHGHFRNGYERLDSKVSCLFLRFASECRTPVWGEEGILSPASVSSSHNPSSLFHLRDSGVAFASDLCDFFFGGARQIPDAIAEMPEATFCVFDPPAHSRTRVHTPHIIHTKLMLTFEFCVIIKLTLVLPREGLIS
ncbi:MAG: hypothetical protein QG589_386 [Patescibacteria group bacterium]|nr:hypothetical protein [Patescibacteria group bacterium]